jgi:LacI family transcriptional regulator
MTRKPHITLEDIAKKLNVSRVTVSKALRGHPDISSETTKLVVKTAKELGYTPNLLARSLSSRRSQMIGLVIPKIAHAFFGSVIEGVYNEAFDHNYETILTVSQENEQRERKHLETLVSMRVDGIIISITQSTKDLGIFDWIRKMGVPLLFIDRQPDPPLPGFSSLVVDDEGGAFKAVEQAIKVGYRKIGCIGGQQNINISQDRMRGLESALRTSGIPLETRWVFNGGFGKSAGYEGLMHLHKQGELPEFIFAMTYPIALGIYEAAKHLGLRIPEDIDLICFGDSDVNHIISPALSCILQPSYELGVKAVDYMLKQLSGTDTKPDEKIILPTDILLRETCTGNKTIVRATKTS